MGYRYKYDSVNSYRIDYMKDVYIMEDRERMDPKTLKEFKDYNSISDYINDHVYMFGEDVIEVRMALKGPYVIQYVHDWFGKNAKIYKENDKLMAKVKCDKLAFFYWAMQYGEHLHIVSPQSMVDWVKKAATEILEQYK